MRISLVIAMGLILGGVSSQAANGADTWHGSAPKSALSQSPVRAYTVQGTNAKDASVAVRGVGGTVTRRLDIVNAVAARLTQGQVEQLRSNQTIRLTVDHGAHVAGGLPPSGVQPYVVTHTRANLLHASGITGLAVCRTGYS